MNRGRSAEWTQPLSVNAQQRRLLLRACDRNPEFLFAVHARRRLCQNGEYRLDLGIADELTFDPGCTRIGVAYGQRRGTKSIFAHPHPTGRD